MAPPATAEPSCAGSMFGSSCTKPPGSSAFGRALFVWLRRVLTLPGDEENVSIQQQQQQPRRSSHDATPAHVVDSIDVTVRDEKPTKQPRTARHSSIASAPSAEALQQQQPPRRPVKTPLPGSASSAASRAACPGTASSAPNAESAHAAAAPGAIPPGVPPPSAGSTAAAPQAASAAPRREIAMRSYVIGGLNFEVDARYRIKSIVGKGAYGLVCAAEDLCPSPSKEDHLSPTPAHESGAPPPPPPPAEPAKAGPAMVAVKKVLDPFHDHTDCKRLLREIRLLRCLRHPNVLHLTDMMPAKSPSPADWKDVYLVTRLFDTNLHRVIYSGHALTDAHIQYILWQVFRALRYLHAAGVVHRDMKPTNLLLNRDCELALADFGLARHMPNHTRAAKDGGGAGATSGAGASPPSVMASAASAEDLSQRLHESNGGGGGGAPPERSKSKGGQLTKYVVTRWYRAPELLVQNRQYDAKVDMWSAGCILAEVLGAKAIFPGKDSLHQLRLVVELLGLPSDDELDMISNGQAVQYIRNLRPKEAAAADAAAAVPRFAKLFPTASPLLLDLMSQLLQFDPRKRPTAAEALAHPYLAAYKDAPEEGLPTPEIEMSFESDAPSTDELRSLIWDEVCRYHPQLAEARPGGAAPAPPTGAGHGEATAV